jgi:hypothetical protein
MRIDIELSNKFWAQWHHDHEIQDVGELNTCQRKQKEAFSLLGFNSMRGGIQGMLYLINSICHYQPTQETLPI